MENLRYIDTHTHLSASDFDEDREDALLRAKEAGVCVLVNIGSGYGAKGNRNALDFALGHEGVYATVGIHPHDAQEADNEMMNEIRDLAADEKGRWCFN